MSKYDRIVQYLFDHSQWIDAQSLSNALTIPKRSLLRYISDLNSQHTNIILSSKKGYQLNREQYEAYQHAQQNKESRTQVIVNRLVFTTHPLMMEDLADELYISYTTLKKDLQSVKQILARYALTLQVTASAMFIEGGEKSKRQLIRDYTYGEVNKGFTDLQSLQQYFPYYDTEHIKGIITDEFTRNRLFADDFVLYSLTLHILVKIERTKANHILPPKDHAGTIQNTIFQTISENICTTLANQYEISFTAAERLEFGILISSIVHEPAASKKANDDILSFVSDDTYQITMKIVHLVYETYGLDLNSSSFINSFSLHLKNLFLRLEHHIAIKNPLLGKLKTTYPFVYEISIFIANSFLETYGAISEDEIAYIALHLGSQVDETQALVTKVNCIVISPEFYSLNKKLIKTLTGRYSEQVIITNVLSSFEELEEGCSYDLIISTMPLQLRHTEKTIRINLLLDQADLKKLDTRIYAALKEKTVYQFKKEMKHFFHKEHFMVVDEVLSFEWIIRQLSASLYQQEYVPEDFALACLKREEISPTTYHEIAIPHPIASLASKSIIGVAINKQHFLWNNKTKVKLVMLLAINKEDLESFRLIFEFISYYANENSDLRKITDAHTFDEFFESLNEYIDQML